MRAVWAASAAVLMAVASGGFDAANAAATTATTAAATVRVVVRPVTEEHHARPGFTVVPEQGLIDCTTPNPSPGAVHRNIQWCYPAAEYAIACWKSATPHRAFCMRNPRVKRLAKIRFAGRFAHAPRPRDGATAPLAMRLANGAFCQIRDGGAWGTLRQHPNWSGTYSCSNGGVVWSPPGARHWGVNESHPSWTVHTAPGSGTKDVVIRHVSRAWFVGTFHA